MSETIETAGTERFRVSETAAARIAAIMQQEPQGSALRVEVLAGGCNGFQYRFDMVSAAEDEDIVIEAGAARVVIDPASLDLLEGGVLEYKDTLMGAYFAVENPNAKTSCGCGTSFSVD